MTTVPKGGRGLAGLAGIACVACCALPVLIAGGVLSGSAATFLADKMPTIAITLAVLAALAFGLAARRKATGTSGCGDSCGRAAETEGACGCAKTPASPSSATPS
jgi:mercuric ion transport protein